MYNNITWMLNKYCNSNETISMEVWSSFNLEKMFAYQLSDHKVNVGIILLMLQLLLALKKHPGIIVVHCLIIQPKMTVFHQISSSKGKKEAY